MRWLLVGALVLAGCQSTPKHVDELPAQEAPNSELAPRRSTERVERAGPGCDPRCLAVLVTIKDRVYARWHPPESAGFGNVRLAFKLGLAGEITEVRVVEAATEELGESCAEALRRASPIPDVDPSFVERHPKGLVGKFGRERY